MTQDKALAILKSGRNVFLTGSAGTGKTYVLNKYIEYLKYHKVPVAVTASTGIAATHMNGMTIHAWSGIGVKDSLSLRNLQFMKSKKYMKKKMEEVKVLIIDEISMLHKKQLELVSQVLQFFKENTLPFGGIQVVFCGDFFQLPPIGSDMETSRDKFAFMSDAWVKAEPVICYLTEQYRQTKNELNQLLNEIRSGEVSPEMVEIVNQKVQETMYADVNRFPQLYTHNSDVDKVNLKKLKEIESEPQLFKATTKGNKVLGETLKKSVLAPEEIYLKLGAEVMFVRNNYEVGYFNGTLGKIKDFSESGFPMVETVDGRWIEAKPDTWSIEDEGGKTLASLTQVPLRLAWAITIHKSQGMTLDQACVDLRKTFERGQGYVALSRLRSMDGLTLLGVNNIAMQMDELASKADKRFAVLSDRADGRTEIEDLKRHWKPFITNSGGVWKRMANGKIGSKAKSKKPTHVITKEMLDQGMTPEEIAKERKYVLSTIFGHLNKIKEQFPDTDFSILSMDAITLNRVKKAMKDTSDETGPKLKEVYEALNKEVPYVDIKKAFLLID